MREETPEKPDGRSPGRANSETRGPRSAGRPRTVPGARPGFRFALPGLRRAGGLFAAGVWRRVRSAGPIDGQGAASNERVERRVWPVRCAGHQTVSDRVEMHVVDTPCQACRIPDRGLPESARPQPPLLARTPRYTDTACTQAHGEFAFDQSPAHGVAVIVFRQAQHGMQMIRKDHDGKDRKRMPATYRTNRGPQFIRMIDQRRGRPIGERHREEVRPTRDALAAVLDHGDRLPSPTRRRPSENTSTRSEEKIRRFT